VSHGEGTSAARRALDTIARLGERDVQATTAIAARFGDRPVHALREMLADDGPLARNLNELRGLAATTVARIQRARPDDGEWRGAMSRSEDRIRALARALDEDRGRLEADNAFVAQQEGALWMEIQTLRQYVVLAGRIDDLLEARIEAVAPEAPQLAGALRTGALYATRLRRRDLLLQLAVATQGYAALRLIEQDNLEVIWGIRAATTTTSAALRTAMLVAGSASGSAKGRLSPGGHLQASLAQSWAAVVAAVGEVDSHRRKTLSEGAG